MEAILLAMTYRQMTSLVMTHLQSTETITRSHLIGSEGFWSDSERGFRKVEFVYEKYHVCMHSTNINQYLAF
jgi:uncharacterized protein (DUF427 family)